MEVEETSKGATQIVELGPGERWQVITHGRDARSGDGHRDKSTEGA